jgi:predicted nucleic acid-binding protein
MILLETSLLALAYEKRSGPEPRPVAVLRRMIRENAPLAIPGIVWQEVLAGVRGDGHFRQLQTHLAAFPILLATENHHAEAARIARACRAKRIPCSAVEALVSAHAVDSRAPLFTLNQAFAPIAREAGFGLFDDRKLAI